MANKKKDTVEASVDPKFILRKGLKMLLDQVDTLEKQKDEDGLLSERHSRMLNNYMKVAISIAKDIKDLGDLSDEILKQMGEEEILALAAEAAQKYELKNKKENKNEN